MMMIGSDLAGSDPQTFFIRNKERQEKLIMWQSNIYQRQVYLFNSLLMIVLIVIWILVSGVQSFNYNTNVINSFWFTFIMVMMRIGFSKLSTKATFHAFAIIISCFRSGHMGLEILSQRSAGKNADSECSHICVFEGHCCVQHNRGRQALSGF